MSRPIAGNGLNNISTLYFSELNCFNPAYQNNIHSQHHQDRTKFRPLISSSTKSFFHIYPTITTETHTPEKTLHLDIHYTV